MLLLKEMLLNRQSKIRNLKFVSTVSSIGRASDFESLNDFVSDVIAAVNAKSALVLQTSLATKAAFIVRTLCFSIFAAAIPSPKARQ